MPGWQHPAAFWFLPLVIVPVIIHLLRVHRANRMLFPSLRFVQPSRSAAVRLRFPSDWFLLLLRMSIVGLAVCAVAAPVMLTERRIAAWNAKVARAVVVDDSDSMQLTTAREAAHAELASAAYGRTFEVKNVDSGIAHAVAWLKSSPPARRELVVISDFQRGTMDANTTAQVPPAIGLRIVNVGPPKARTTIAGTEMLGFDKVATRQQAIELTNDTTAVSLESRQPPPIEGLRVVNATTEERDALLRTLAIAGTPASSPQEPIAIVFDTEGAKQGTAAAALELTPLHDGWMLRTALRMRDDRSLISTAASAVATRPLRGEPPWAPLVTDRQGHPMVSAATARNELVLRVAAAPDSLLAVAVGRAALRGRHATNEYVEHEIASIDAAALATWTRAPAAVDRTAWRTADSNDSRWCWLAALILLGVEQFVRVRRLRTAQEVARVAA
jgi:hypothetical protein